MKSARHAALLLLGTLVAVEIAGAQGTAPNTDWDCEPCDASTGWFLDLQGGFAYVNDDAFRFGNHSGLDESGWYLFGDVVSRYTDADATFLNIEGFLRGEDSNALFAEGGKQGVYSVWAEYQSIPQRSFGSGTSPFSGIGSDSLALPSTWVRGANTTQMTDLAVSSLPIEIGFDRTNYGIGFGYGAFRHWSMTVDYRRREKEGVRRTAGSFLFNALELASPVDYATDDLEVTVSYARETWQVEMAYFSSIFDNNREALTWDNPYLAINGEDSGQMAHAPDNEFHQITLSGALQLPARTVLSGQLSTGTLEQNDLLLPYTVNPTIAAPALPISRLNGEVETLNYNLRIVSSPIAKLSLDAELRYNEFDNKTPIDNFQFVFTDVGLDPTAVTNTAFDYERREFRLGGNYRLRRGMRLYAGYENRSFNRSDQVRRRTDTGRFWLRLKSRWSGVAEIDLDYFAEDRDGSSFDINNPAFATENPLMRKYNLSDRDREGVRLRAAWLGLDRLDLQVEVETTDDKYGSSTMGLLASDYSRVGASFSWLFGKASSIYAMVDKETIETDQANSQSFSLPDWTATNEDEFMTGTVGAEFPNLFGSRLGGRFSYTRSEAEGTSQSNTNGLVNQFPDVSSERETLNVGLDYPYSDSLRLSLDVFHESVATDDWALDGVNPDTARNLLSFGVDMWNYDQTVVYLSVRYQLNPN